MKYEERKIYIIECIRSNEILLKKSKWNKIIVYMSNLCSMKRKQKTKSFVYV